MKKERLNVGFIGLGQRGSGLLPVLLTCPEVDVVALSDLYEDRMEDARKVVEKTRGNTPALYADYRALIADERVEAVMIASSWDEHTRMAVAAMKAGKPVAVEVAGAYDIEDCWELVRTYEETGTPIMLLENCCYGKFELLANSLARAGRLGRVMYCHGAYAHELREEIYGGNVNRHYRLKNYMKRNCENYPTHELGPIAKLLDINRGNKMLTLTSVATKGGVGLEEYVDDKRNPDPSLKGTSFAQGDIVVTTITCAGGEVITLRLDTTLPRTYSREFTVQGTKGYCKQDADMVMLESEVSMHESFEPDRIIEKHIHNSENYRDYLPDIWKEELSEEAKRMHGGMDGFVIRAFVDAVLNGEEMPIDVYDMAAWMAITPLSEQSIACGGMPQAIPDFTRGKWILREVRDVVPMPTVEKTESDEIPNAFGRSRG